MHTGLSDGLANRSISLLLATIVQLPFGHECQGIQMATLSHLSRVNSSPLF